MNKKNIVALITILTMLLATSGTNFAFADNGNVGYKLDTLIEVENCSHSGMTTRKVNSPYASGGVYVVNTGSDIAAPGDIMTDDVSLMVDVAATNKTRVFVRVLFPSGSGTAFYWRFGKTSIRESRRQKTDDSGLR